MPAQPSCVRCGTELKAAALWGLCPKCLLEQAQTLPVGESASRNADRRFGEYELGEQIGRGGMGVVYKAVHVTLLRTVALKLILDTESESPQARRRFAFEAETAARLDHPHIVPIYEMGEVDGHLFLAMKLIAGKTLREQVKSGALCLNARPAGTSRSDLRHCATAIARLTATVARAVHHAHESGVLHRDLKPGNILVDRDGQPHLTDFGLAKRVDGPVALDGTESGTTLGTPCYMSPEQAAGRALSPASDVYSLGAILYEMLTGQPPFKAGTVLETLRLVSEHPPRRPSLIHERVDRDLDTICLKCLEKNPSARYATAGDLAEDLERWLRSEPIRARRASIALRAGRWVKRNPAGAAAIGSLGLALVATLSLLWVAAEARRRAEELSADAKYRFNQQVEELWHNTNKTHVVISSSWLAQLANTPVRPPGPNPIELKLAIIIDHNPFGQAMNYAPVITMLEKRMEAMLSRRVLLDLWLYKFTGDGAQAPVAMGEVDFQRLGPVRYIQAKDNTPGLQVVIGETLPKEGVIFARKGLAISNLQHVAGHCVAFAHTNSTISFLSRAYLQRADVMASDLNCVTNLDNPTPWSSASANPRIRLPATSDNDSEMYAHQAVVQRVLMGEFDVGEAPSRHFEMNKERGVGLVELARFPVISDVYVARSGLSSVVVDSWRQCLLSMKSRQDRKLLGRLRPLLDGFTPLTDRDFDSLRSLATNEVRLFETSPPRPRQTNKGRLVRGQP